MGHRMSLFQLVGATFLVGTAVMGVADTAIAQATQDAPSEALVAQIEDVPRVRSSRDVRPLPTIPEAFNRAYYRNDGNFFDNRSIWQEIRLIIGVPSYIDNAISEDGRRVDRLYKEVLEQQVSSDPILRTPDLPNPYTGSVLTTPLVISEEPITPLQPFPPIRRRGPVEPAPVAPEAVEEGPVPALW